MAGSASRKKLGARPAGRASGWSCSADGRVAAVPGADSALCVYALTSSLPPTRIALPAPSASVAVSARHAAAASRDGRVFAGDRAKALVECGAVADPPRPLALACSDGIVLAAGGAARELLIVKLGQKPTTRAVPMAKLHASPISAVALGPKAIFAAVCCQAVTLVDLESGKAVRRYQGHQTPVSASVFLPAGDGSPVRFITACAGDKFLSVWEAPSPTGRQPDAPSSAKKRRKDALHSACHTLVAPEAGVSSIVVDTASARDASSEQVSIAAVLPSGCVAVWRNWEPQSSQATTSCSFVVRPADEDVLLFVGFPRAGKLVVAHGHQLRPSFFTVDLKAVEDDCVNIPAANTEGLLSADPIAGAEDPSKRTGREAAARAERTVSVASKHAAAIRPKEKPSMNGHAPDDGEHGVEGDSDGSGAEMLEGMDVDDEHGEFSESVEEGQTVSEKVAKAKLSEKASAKGKKRKSRSRDEASESDDDEPTLQEKLAAMGVAGGSKLADLSSKSSLRNSSGSTRLAGMSGPGGGTVDSVGNVLMQAIQTKDEKLFDTVVASTTKVQAIRNTVSSLPFTVATSDLLNMLVSRLVHRPSRAAALMPWVKEILMEHAGTLSSQGRSPALDRLLHAITARVETLPALTRLEGRLELMIAQADRVRAARRASATRTEAAVQFVETAKDMNTREGGVPTGDLGEVRLAVEEAAKSGDESEDEEDADETGDFSEEDSDEQSSSWEDDESDAEDGDAEEDQAPSARANTKAKLTREMIDLEASESDS